MPEARAAPDPADVGMAIGPPGGNRTSARETAGMSAVLVATDAAGAPAYWDEACAGLSAADPVLARIIQEAGAARLTSRGDPFVTLARSIVGQQISVKAAQSVWLRFAKAARTVTPDRVRRMRATTLAACGLSARKGEYLKDLAERFATGEVDPAHWPSMPDEAVIAELVRVRGIGRWTAEMFLIFNLLRPDVLPLDDLGLLNAMGRLWHDGIRPTRAQADARADAWRPWRTVATWYLWRSLDPLPVEY